MSANSTNPDSTKAEKLRVSVDEKWFVARSGIKLGRQIGAGAFGEVHMCKKEGSDEIMVMRGPLERSCLAHLGVRALGERKSWDV